MLRRLKETGCIDSNFGQESGSETILKEYRKGVSVTKNMDITFLSKDLGLICPVQIVIGSPRETQMTIEETIRFFKAVHAGNPFVNILLAFPETPRWQYVVEHNLIQDEGAYLEGGAKERDCPIVNLTRFPDRIWRSWNFRIKNEIRLDNIRNRGNPLKYAVMNPVIKAVNAAYLNLPLIVLDTAKNLLYH